MRCSSIEAFPLGRRGDRDRTDLFSRSHHDTHHVTLYQLTRNGLGIGDKEVFALCYRALNIPYFKVPRSITPVGFVTRTKSQNEKKATQVTTAEEDCEHAENPIACRQLQQTRQVRRLWPNQACSPLRLFVNRDESADAALGNRPSFWTIRASRCVFDIMSYTSSPSFGVRRHPFRCTFRSKSSRRS